MRIAVLGTGNMGKALMTGLLSRSGGDLSIMAYDINPKASESLPQRVSVCNPDSWFTETSCPDLVLISVKPGEIVTAVGPVASRASQYPEVLWCSIAAGVSIASLEKILGPSAKVCRAMPNMPALIGEGMTAFALNSRCSSVDAETAYYLFSACGKAVQVEEKLMNAVTGLSGSGPAYVYLFIEALVEGGVAAGLPLQVAKACALQTIQGAARMVERTGEDPAALKARVMSPAGTTVQGLMALEQHGFKYSVMRAVVDAAKRSAELGA
jgi:pyrroline-5-carboxylate reductase